MWVIDNISFKAVGKIGGVRCGGYDCELREHSFFERIVGSKVFVT